MNGNTTTLTVTVEDANSNPITGQAVTFSSSGTGYTFSATTCTTSAGVCSVTLKSTTIATVVVMASFAGISKTANVTFTLACSGNPNYRTVTLTVGNNSPTVAVGDFTGDGNLDIATANFGSGNVSIVPGHGNGTFGTAVSYGVGTEPIGIAVADFNGDGNLDITTANQSTNNVSVLLNHGNGTLAGALTCTCGSAPFNAAAGDFNGDGILDIAVAINGGSNNTVNVLLFTGCGVARASARLSTHSQLSVSSEKPSIDPPSPFRKP